MTPETETEPKRTNEATEKSPDSQRRGRTADAGWTDGMEELLRLHIYKHSPGSTCLKKTASKGHFNMSSETVTLDQHTGYNGPVVLMFSFCSPASGLTNNGGFPDM